MKKLKIGILMGGASAEHEVSLASGAEILKHIETSKYIPQKLLIRKNGKFAFTQKDLENQDLIFIALHGESGENGAIQGYLEMLGIPYTGSSVLASAIGMDKHLCKRIWADAGLPTVLHTIVKSISECTTHKLPFVLKPRNQGSSVGVTIVRSKNQISKAYKDASQFKSDVMLEPYIDGPELTVGVIGENPDKLKALPIIHIIPATEFYDYEAKYIRDDTQYVVPADIPNSATKKVQELAVEACRTIGVKGMSRVDIMMNKNNPLLLEINTIPGFTSHSLLPKAAQADGIEFGKLIDLIIHYALK